MINNIFKPKGSRIWRWKFRLVPADGKILDVSLGTSDRQSAETKRSDLKAANIAKIDSQGRVVDFHSLRHTFCTNLHRAGVSQREAMELMRHNDPRLTAITYTDTSLLSLQSAVQKLGFPASQIASQKLGADGQSLSLPVNDSREVSV